MTYRVQEERYELLPEDTSFLPPHTTMPSKSTTNIHAKNEEKGSIGHMEHSLEKTTIEEKVSWRNLPEKKQLLLLALCRLSGPLSNACLLPYLYHLISSILSEPDHPSVPQRISRLTGLLVAAYPLGQMMTSMIWGRLADRYGRKLAILLGVTISVIANIGFGFSKSIGMLLFWRFLAGMANGILGVVRTMTAEVVREKKYRARAFLAMPVVFNIGRVAALVIGGCLADPVRNVAWLFGPNGLFNVEGNEDGVEWASEYPYALPALFNGTVLATCVVLASFGLRETLPAREKRRVHGLAVGESIMRFLRRWTVGKVEFSYTAIGLEEGGTTAADAFSSSTIPGASKSDHMASHQSSRFIWTKPLLKTLVAFGLLPLHNATFLHVFPVFLSMPTYNNPHPISLRFIGGLGHSPPTVGILLAIIGIFGILLQLFIYPRLHSRIGTLGVFWFANALFPFAYLFAPFLSLLSGHKIMQWPAVTGVLFIQVMARTMAIPSSVILLTETAPQRNVLGSVHGTGNALGAFSSAMGPAVGGFLLSRSIEIGIIGLVWWCWLLVIALGAVAWSFLLSSAKLESKALEPEE